VYLAVLGHVAVSHRGWVPPMLEPRVLRSSRVCLTVAAVCVPCSNRCVPRSQLCVPCSSRVCPCSAGVVSRSGRVFAPCKRVCPMLELRVSYRSSRVRPMVSRGCSTLSPGLSHHAIACVSRSSRLCPCSAGVGPLSGRASSHHATGASHAKPLGLSRHAIASAHVATPRTPHPDQVVPRSVPSRARGFSTGDQLSTDRLHRRFSSSEPIDWHRGRPRVGWGSGWVGVWFTRGAVDHEGARGALAWLLWSCRV
jgi:hypothetical protein